MEGVLCPCDLFGDLLFGSEDGVGELLDGGEELGEVSSTVSSWWRVHRLISCRSDVKLI